MEWQRVLQDDLPRADSFPEHLIFTLPTVGSLSPSSFKCPDGKSQTEEKLTERFLAATFLAVILAGLASGCTDIERRGVSPIPQNRPASWETRPFGNIHN